MVMYKVCEMHNSHCKIYISRIGLAYVQCCCLVWDCWASFDWLSEWFCCTYLATLIFLLDAFYGILKEY